jgi:hypothetical protein
VAARSGLQLQRASASQLGMRRLGNAWRKIAACSLRAMSTIGDNAIERATLIT